MQRFHKRNLAWLGMALLCYALIWSLVHFGIITTFYQRALIDIMLNIMFAVGLNLVLGVAGQFSLGHAGFIAIGAYSGAIMSTRMENGTYGLILGALVGVVIATIVALIVGIPTLRLRGDYLAIATLGVAEIIRVLINNLTDLTNGPAGISGIPMLVTWPLVYVCMVLTLIFTLNYVYSSAGRATMAIQQNEIAAQAMGINVTKYKVIAFVIGAITAAIAGTLQASYLGIVVPGAYNFQRSIDVLIIVVFGGIGSFTGSILAAIVLGLLNVVLQDYGQLRMIIYAMALVLIMIFRPQGLLGTWEFKLGQRLFPNKSSQKEAVS